MSTTPQSFPYSIPKQGFPITSQEDLISDLTLALGLIHSPTTQTREQGAQIMIELMRRPIEPSADRLSAMSQAKQNIQQESES